MHLHHQAGTWTSKGSFTDTIAAGESATDTYQLWRKIASGNSPTEYRPIKASANATSSSVSEMNNTDIKTLTDRLRNRIISTGVGTYKLQTAAPATGTWLQVSDSITDNLADVTLTTILTAVYRQFFKTIYKSVLSAIRKIIC